jgi:DNA uptake protein ComE-like DNA-binding protein
MLAALGSACSMFDHGGHAEAHRSANLDLNAASRKQLGELRGLSDSDVDRIVAGRPYAKKRELVDRGILNQKKFDAIHDDVEVVQGNTGAR